MTKIVKFASILMIFMLATINAFAGLSGEAVVASIDAVSSDCKSVTIDYTVARAGSENLVLNVTGFDGDFDISETVGSHSVTVPITRRDNGTAIVVVLRGSVFFSSQVFYLFKDERTITCSETDDGRIEPFWADHVIYPLNEGIFVYSDDGELALVIPVETIEMIAVPETTPRLLGETADGYVRVFRLSDGRYQALIGPDGEGKVHIVFWNGLGFIHSVESTTQLNQ